MKKRFYLIAVLLILNILLLPVSVMGGIVQYTIDGQPKNAFLDLGWCGASDTSMANLAMSACKDYSPGYCENDPLISCIYNEDCNDLLPGLPQPGWSCIGCSHDALNKRMHNKEVPPLTKFDDYYTFNYATEQVNCYQGGEGKIYMVNVVPACSQFHHPEFRPSDFPCQVNDDCQLDCIEGYCGDTLVTCNEEFPWRCNLGYCKDYDECTLMDDPNIGNQVTEVGGFSYLYGACYDYDGDGDTGPMPCMEGGCDGFSCPSGPDCAAGTDCMENPFADRSNECWTVTDPGTGQDYIIPSGYWNYPVYKKWIKDDANFCTKLGTSICPKCVNSQITEDQYSMGGSCGDNVDNDCDEPTGGKDCLDSDCEGAPCAFAQPTPPTPPAPAPTSAAEEIPTHYCLYGGCAAQCSECYIDSDDDGIPDDIDDDDDNNAVPDYEDPDDDGDGILDDVDTNNRGYIHHGGSALAECVVDEDGDQWIPNPSTPEDGQLDGTYNWCLNDCDDQDSDRHPTNSEKCDLKDNDCDGIVDNDINEPDGVLRMVCYSGPAWSIGPDGNPYGSCRKGKRTCTDGSLGPCEGEVLPQEITNCDYTSDEDVNCNGVIDNQEEVCDCSDPDWDGDSVDRVLCNGNDCDDNPLDDPSVCSGLLPSDCPGDYSGYGAPTDYGKCAICRHGSGPGDIAPAAEVACDRIDQDCNGADSEGRDDDEDGFSRDWSCPQRDCFDDITNQPSYCPVITEDQEPDDVCTEDLSGCPACVYPGKKGWYSFGDYSELCDDDIDNDCNDENGAWDSDFSHTGRDNDRDSRHAPQITPDPACGECIDNDGDGYGETPSNLCDNPEGDCDDDPLDDHEECWTIRDDQGAVIYEVPEDERTMYNYINEMIVYDLGIIIKDMIDCGPDGISRFHMCAKCVHPPIEDGPEEEPEDEREFCDGVDNDCDDKVDEKWDNDYDTYTTCGTKTDGESGQEPQDPADPPENALIDCDDDPDNDNDDNIPEDVKEEDEIGNVVYYECPSKAQLDESDNPLEEFNCEQDNYKYAGQEDENNIKDYASCAHCIHPGMEHCGDGIDNNCDNDNGDWDNDYRTGIDNGLDRDNDGWSVCVNDDGHPEGGDCRDDPADDPEVCSNIVCCETDATSPTAYWGLDTGSGGQCAKTDDIDCSIVCCAPDATHPNAYWAVKSMGCTEAADISDCSGSQPVDGHQTKSDYACGSLTYADCSFCVNPGSSRQCGLDSKCESINGKRPTYSWGDPIDGFEKVDGKWVWNGLPDDTTCGIGQCVIYGETSPISICPAVDQSLCNDKGEIEANDPVGHIVYISTNIKYSFIPGGYHPATSRDAECGIIANVKEKTMGESDAGLIVEKEFDYPLYPIECYGETERKTISSRYGELDFEKLSKDTIIEFNYPAQKQGLTTLSSDIPAKFKNLIVDPELKQFPESVIREFVWRTACVPQRDKCKDGVDNDGRENIFGLIGGKWGVTGEDVTIKDTQGNNIHLPSTAVNVRLTDVDDIDCYGKSDPSTGIEYCIDEDDDMFCRNSKFFPDCDDIASDDSSQYFVDVVGADGKPKSIKQPCSEYVATNHNVGEQVVKLEEDPMRCCEITDSPFGNPRYRWESKSECDETIVWDIVDDSLREDSDCNNYLGNEDDQLVCCEYDITVIDQVDPPVSRQEDDKHAWVPFSECPMAWEPPSSPGYIILPSGAYLRRRVPVAPYYCENDNVPKPSVIKPKDHCLILKEWKSYTRRTKGDDGKWEAKRVYARARNIYPFSVLKSSGTDIIPEKSLISTCGIDVDTNCNKDGVAGYNHLQYAEGETPFDNDMNTGVEGLNDDGDYFCTGSEAAFWKRFFGEWGNIISRQIKKRIPTVQHAAFMGLMTIGTIVFIGVTGPFGMTLLSGLGIVYGTVALTAGATEFMYYSIAGGDPYWTKREDALFMAGEGALAAAGSLKAWREVSKLCPVRPKDTGHCFLANTPILMSDGTYKNIQDINVGENLIAYDIYNDSAVNATVSTTFQRNVTEYLIIDYDVEDEE